MSRYHRFDFPDLPPDAFKSVDGRRGRIRLHGGGGGGTFYENLEKLYGEQVENAKMLRGESVKSFGDLEQMRGLAAGYGSQANQDRMAAQAGADFRDASDSQLRAAQEDMASMGISPTDDRWMRQVRTAGVQNAAGQAGVQNAARSQVEGQGFARLQDVTSIGQGMPGQATSAFNSAGQMASNAGQMRMNQATQNTSNIGSAVRGGMDLYKALADGGYVHLAKGGYVQRLAGGGAVGALRGIQTPPPPTGGPVPSTASTVASAAAPMMAVKGAPGVVGKGIQAVGQATNSPGMVAFGNGMAVPKGADPSVAQFFTSPDTVAQQMATSQVNAELGAGAAEAGNAALGVAEGAAAAEGTAAAGAAGAAEGLAGLGAAGSALGTAMPWLGGAMLLGSALGLFADGGEVTPGAHAAKGGEVDGPGGPKDDLIPAMLSDGEFVLPVGTVKKYGLQRLEKMRQEGLEFEKQLGIH